MKALDHYVFLKFKKETKKDDGIILSDVSKDKPAVAFVEAVGDKVEGIKVGDKVVFDPFMPRSLKVDGVEYFVLKDKYIYGKN